MERRAGRRGVLRVPVDSPGWQPLLQDWRQRAAEERRGEPEMRVKEDAHRGRVARPLRRLETSTCWDSLGNFEAP